LQMTHVVTGPASPMRQSACSARMRLCRADRDQQMTNRPPRRRPADSSCASALVPRTAPWAPVLSACRRGRGCSAVRCSVRPSRVPQDRPAPRPVGRRLCSGPGIRAETACPVTRWRRRSAAHHGRPGSGRTSAGRGVCHRAAGGRRRVRGRCSASVRNPYAAPPSATAAVAVVEQPSAMPGAVDPTCEAARAGSASRTGDSMPHHGALRVAKADQT
jgi:hypothetical protein